VKQKISPEPWTMSGYTIIDRDYETVAQNVNKIEDGRLIIAAPEMFELLEEINCLVFPENELDPIWPVWQNWFEKWKKLKQKIEGGEHE